MGPIDGEARNRLRAAQVAECRALAAVGSATRSLAKRRRQVTQQVMALNADVRTAELAVRRAQAELVGISGLERAADLLGVHPKQLRRTLSRRSREEAAETDTNG